MTMRPRNGGLLASLLLTGCAMTGQLPTAEAPRAAAAGASSQPLPDYPAECSTAKTAESPYGLGDPAIYHAVCRTGWDGRVAPLAFGTLLGGDDSDMTASFRFAAAALNQRSRDVISFPQLVKPSHFDPIPWNSAADGARRTEPPGIKGEFRLLGHETVMFTPPGQSKPEKCVAVSFTLPPQDTPLGRIAGATTRLLRCDSGHAYRVPAFGS